MSKLLEPSVTVERDGHVLLIGLDRPAKRNAFTLTMLAELSAAYGLLESDPELRCGVLFAHGEHFTGGLDMVDVGPALQSGQSPYPRGGGDPWRLTGDWTTPVVAAAHGWVMTLGIELLLAADIRVAAADARFAQLEVRRGIYPFGGATVRLPREVGWGNAMRWILTGDEYDATEAHRIGLVQEVAPDRAAAISRATELAHTIAERAAPLGVATSLRSAHLARREGDAAAAAASTRTSPCSSRPRTAARGCCRSSSADRRASRAADPLHHSPSSLRPGAHRDRRAARPAHSGVVRPAARHRRRPLLGPRLRRALHPSRRGRVRRR